MISQQTFDEMLSSLQKILKINTVKAPAEKNAPFGKGNAECLKAVLSLAEKMGFETYNCDNYAGHVDFGKGDEVFGILGHLDVVPVAEKGWIKPPFGGEIFDGYLYGRGTLDDKGPMIACLYALKQLKDEGFVPGKKIRLIFGCDEESGWGCMDYYKQKVNLPDIGFSPDGDFPVINVEKGVCHLILDVGVLPDGITDVGGGERCNIVLDECFSKIKGNVKLPSDENVKITEDNGGFVITATGKAAHGSTPQFGDNAAWKLFALLKKTYPDDETINFVADRICGGFDGKGLGIDFEDQPSGKTTVNVGFLRKHGNRLLIGLDIRYPVTYTLRELLDNIKKNSPDGAEIEITGKHDPLYVPADNPLVTGLLDVFEKVTGRKEKPLAVGGATYARALPLGVAFGPVFEEDGKVIHETNERISLEKLKLTADLYYLAIKTLCK